MFNNLAEAKKFIEENGIEMVDFMMIDLIGRWRHLTVPSDRFDEETLRSGIGFDGSNYGFAPVEKSDMVFIPDLTTAYVDQFMKIPTLAMIGDVFVIKSPDNLPFSQYPRNVSKRGKHILKAQG